MEQYCPVNGILIEQIKLVIHDEEPHHPINILYNASYVADAKLRLSQQKRGLILG